MTYFNNQYKLIRSLGGNTAEVFLALDRLKTGTTEVAVKIFSVNSDTRLNEELFYRETQALTRLDHPGIVRFHDAGRDERGIPFIATQFVEGKMLQEYWVPGVSNLSDFFRITIEILEAMSHAHSKTIVHRDLKPSNILVDDNERVRIIDFAVAKVLDAFRLGMTLKDFITLAFASPEQLSRTNVGTPSDVYSVGAIMFWMLTGQTRSEGEDLGDLIRRSELDGRLKAVLIEFTDPEFEVRPQTAASALQRLQQVAQELTSATISFALILTQNAVNKLYALNELSSATEGEAREVILNDLASETYAYQDGNDFYVIGRRLKLICVIDNASRSALAVRNITIPANQFLEADKEKSMVVPGMFRIVPMRTQPPSSPEFEKLLQRLHEHSATYARRREAETSSKGLVAQWERVLGLQRQLATLDELRIPYLGYTLTDDGLLIVELEEPLPDLPFTNEQSFALTQLGAPRRQVNAGTYVETSGRTLVLLAYRGTTEDKLHQLVAQTGELSVNRADIMASLNRQQRALSILRYGDSVNARLPDILLHPERVTSAPLAGPMQFWHQELDESKQIAVRKALAANDLFLVQGPPGTGKTTFIAELVYQILKSAPRSRILLTSQSHVAVDQALGYVAKVLGTEVSMVRVGRRDRITTQAQQFMLEEQLQAWVQHVINRSDTYSKEQSQALGAHAHELEMLRSMDLVQDNWTQVRALDDRISLLAPELEQLSQGMVELENLQLQLESMREKLSSASTSVFSSRLVETVGRFREDYLRVGETFLGSLERHSGDIERYENLCEEVDGLRSKRARLYHDAQAGLQTLRSLVQLPERDLDSEGVAETKEQLLAQTQHLRQSLEQFAHIDRVRQEWLGRLGKQDEHDTMFVDQVQILAGTLLGVAPFLYRDDTEFDWVIIDEAARATAPELLVPAVRGRKIVLVGDHHQLPPMLDRDIHDELLTAEGITRSDLETTLFEHLFLNLPEHAKVKLTDQWRMHPGIGNLISHVFYEDSLASRAPAQPRSLLNRWNGKTVVWYSTSPATDRYELQVGTSYVNNYEVRVITQLLAELENDLRSKSIKATVGVIAGYSPQRDALRNTLDPDDVERWQAVDLRVDTVDSFQGQETDVVFYSMVRSNKARNLGFLADARRLNVALSRGRHLMIIVGDYEVATLAVAKPDNRFVDVARHIRKNPEYCHIEES